MLGRILKNLFGPEAENRRYIEKNIIPVLEDVHRHEAACVAMTNDELRAQTGRFKDRLVADESLDDLLPEAFATVREAAKRVCGMRPFDVQIIGGVVLHNGGISEMVTGEGKTLVATMPVYLNALTGQGVHVVTVNDHLARRDREWMGPIYEFLGLTVGVILHDLSTAERQVAYRADITYGTNNEFGFDYLRDNMAVRSDMRVQRGLNYAIIDEVDSILIDEARTPLIISGRPEKSTDTYYKVDDIVRRLRKEKHYEIEEKGQHVLLTDEGMEYAESLLGIDNLYSNDHLGVVHMIHQALRAHNFFKRDDEYMLHNGEVLIVDEFTGRAMEGRRYSDGLHQAIEAKERVPVQFESQTIASISYQNYFKLYNKIAGMTGTAATEAMEFSQIYKLDVVTIPTNLPLRRQDQNDLIFATEEGKFRYVTDEIAEISKTGRPVLIGTVSIEKSELVANLLDEKGLHSYEVLNAKHHEREAAIIANAGQHGAVTIATNMAGRGTDIKLAEGVAELGGLAVVGTERHESRRIDNQLRGRCGRQGDPGTTGFYVSLQDEVARLFGGDKVKRLIDLVGGEQMDDEPLSQRMVSRSIERAQRQVEQANYEVRKHLLEYDDVMNKQRQVIYKMRTDVLEDRDITEQLHAMFENLIAEAVDNYGPGDSRGSREWDPEGLEGALKTSFAGMSFDVEGVLCDDSDTVIDALFDQAADEYRNREGLIAEETRRAFREQIGGDESAIDFEQIARKRVHDLEMMALLRAVDDKWIDHLYSMDYLRDSVRLRAFGQKDPLAEYKREGYELFQEMLAAIELSTVSTLFRLTDPEVRRTRDIRARRGTLSAQEDPFAQLSQYTYLAADKQQDRSFASYDTSRFALAGQQDGAASSTTVADRPDAPKAAPIRTGPKIGPNDPCPCGSGKKYKKCCGGQAD